MEIVPEVHWMKNFVSHYYLIADKELTLIDTGMPHQAKKILRYITDELHRTPSDLKTIILTHCDIDHIGNARELRSLTGAKIAAHPLDAEIIAGKKNRITPKGGMSRVFGIIRAFMRVKSFQVDTLIDQGDNLSDLTVLHMPGHTAGSIALFDSRRKVLFIGDALGCRNGVVHGPPKNVTMDMKQALQSIEKLKNLNFTVLLSGHGEPLTNNASTKVAEFLETTKKKEQTT
jgi:glyoxylase-like metal-dependent hydrolase (beta-lactamase superfamily II)